MSGWVMVCGDVEVMVRMCEDGDVGDVWFSFW